MGGVYLNEFVGYVVRNEIGGGDPIGGVDVGRFLQGIADGGGGPRNQHSIGGGCIYSEVGSNLLPGGSRVIDRGDFGSGQSAVVKGGFIDSPGDKVSAGAAIAIAAEEDRL